MERKKILIVSASFYPENSPRSFRTTELIKEFARQQHSVTLITQKKIEPHQKFETKYKIVIKDMGERRYKSISIKGKGVNRLIRRFLLRFSKLLFEYPDIELFWMVRNALRKESGYDLLISIAVPYPVHWGVAAVRSETHKIARTWVADCGDPYVGKENDTFKVPFYFGFIEKWFMKRADFISVPTVGAISAYFPEFHKKIKVIPQGFRFEDYKFDNNKVKNPCPTFAYAGMFIPGRRDPAEFIEYLRQLDINFRFHIYTKTPRYVPEIEEADRARIIIHEPIPRMDLLEILNEMDFLVNFENVGNKQTPSKIIDYLIIGKPIMSVRTGQLDKNLVKEFLAGKYDRKMLIQDPCQYRIENVCEKFLQLV